MESWRSVRVPSLAGEGQEPSVIDTASGELVCVAAGPHASLYACGITPYDATHIGHAATYLAWDLLIRAWLDAGHQVTYVQNTTDVDDPLLERADRDGEDWRELAAREIARYRSDMAALRILPPDHLVGAVEALGVIEEFAHQLSERGALYDLDGDTYFSRGCDPGFGMVSKFDTATMTMLSAERGGDPDRAGKKDPLDALVWLAARPGEPSWESEFGPGRPGWHVECAAIATRYLGRSFDVQAGGSDLIFPHHEMSASHARAASGDPGAFARYYVHAGMVRLDGDKMSKSQGNLVFVGDLLAEGADPMAVRLALLAHHFRHDWDWTSAGLTQAQARLSAWRAAMARGLSGGAARPGDGGGPGGGGPGGGGLGAGSGLAAHPVLAAVRERLASDLDAPGALQVVDRWAEGAAVRPPSAESAAEAALVRDTLDALLGVAL